MAPFALIEWPGYSGPRSIFFDNSPDQSLHQLNRHQTVLPGDPSGPSVRLPERVVDFELWALKVFPSTSVDASQIHVRLTRNEQIAFKSVRNVHPTLRLLIITRRLGKESTAEHHHIGASFSCQ